MCVWGGGGGGGGGGKRELFFKLGKSYLNPIGKEGAEIHTPIVLVEKEK